MRTWPPWDVTRSSTRPVPADQRVVAEHRSGPAGSRRDDGAGGPGPGPRSDAPTAASTCTHRARPTSGGDHPDQRAGGQHQQDQVEAEQLEHAESDGQAEPDLPGVEPLGKLHLPSLSAGVESAGVSRRARARRRADQRSSTWLSSSGMPNVAESISSVSTSSSGPAATTRPSRSSSPWVKPGGISSTWWETSTVAGDVSSRASEDSVRDEVLAAAEVQPRGGLVEQQQLRVGHQRAGDLHALALPLGQRPEGAVRQPRGADLARAAGRRGRGRARRSARASGRGRRTTRRPRRRATRSSRGDPLGQGGAGQPDARPQLEDVDRAEHLPEDPGHPGGGVDRAPRRPAAGWSCRRRWGRAPPSARPPRPSSRCPSSRVAWPRRTVTSASSRTASMGAAVSSCCGGRGRPTYTAPRPARRPPRDAGPARPRRCVRSSGEPVPAAAVRPVRPVVLGLGLRAGPAWTTPGTRSSPTTPPTTWSGCPAVRRRAAADRRARAAAQPAGAAGAGLALPVPGDLLGLAGPSTFNAEVVEVGEAVVLDGADLGLVPHRPGAGVVWRCHQAVSRPPAARPVGGRPGAAARAAARPPSVLGDLDVARWRPEVADELMALRRSADLHASPTTWRRAPSRLASLSTPVRTIVDLALVDDGGERHRGRGGRATPGTRSAGPCSETGPGGRLHLSVGEHSLDRDMDEPSRTLLITLTGKDRPGVTSSIFSTLAASGSPCSTSSRSCCAAGWCSGCW